MTWKAKRKVERSISEDRESANLSDECGGSHGREEYEDDEDEDVKTKKVDYTSTDLDKF